MLTMGLLDAAFWGALGASSLLIGAVVALRLRPSARATGLVMGFGAGALLSAVAYELVPEAVLAGVGVPLAVGAGALTFFGADWLVDRRGGAERKDLGGPTGEAGDADSASTGRAIVLGTLLDGVPESLVLGMGLAVGGAVSASFLVAVFVSNLPEAVGGTAALRAAGTAPRAILATWAGLVAASGVAAAIGYGMVRVIPAADGTHVQAFAAGAVLTMLADTMMPEAFEHGGKPVALLTVLGFLLAGLLSIQE
jgi:zinc transporter, ZIP family